MLAPDYPVQTERLLLRPIDPVGDLDAVHAYQSLPDIVRYVPYGPRTRDEVARRLAAAVYRPRLDAEGDVLGLGIVVRETGRLIGDVILFWRSKEHGTGELGYILHPDAHGRGYATEACEAMFRLGFDGLGLHRIIARIDARNDPSAAVLSRLGMRQEAHLIENEWFKGEWTDEIDFAILATEWTARQASA